MDRTFAFIVGAPRCGTTSLAGFLKQHPEVCFSKPKEPHYFSRRDLAGLGDAAAREAVEAEYLDRFFPHRGKGETTMAEGSVSYLYAPERMERVLRLFPNARFIIAVRDPLQMLPSLHRRLLYLGDEVEADFERAWALMAIRAKGRRVPRSCLDPRLLQYAEGGRLGHYLERFFAVVGRERCMVSVFDDLSRRPSETYGRMCDFLALEPRGGMDLAPRRASQGFRSAWLQRLLKRPPVVTRMILAGEGVRQRIGPARTAKVEGAEAAFLWAVRDVRRSLLDWNRASAPPVRLSPGLREEICGRLAEDRALLSRLIGRDLSHWLGGTAAQPAVVEAAPRPAVWPAAKARVPMTAAG